MVLLILLAALAACVALCFLALGIHYLRRRRLLNSSLEAAGEGEGAHGRGQFWRARARYSANDHKESQYLTTVIPDWSMPQCDGHQYVCRGAGEDYILLQLGASDVDGAYQVCVCARPRACLCVCA